MVKKVTTSTHFYQATTNTHFIKLIYGMKAQVPSASQSTNTGLTAIFTNQTLQLQAIFKMLNVELVKQKTMRI